MHVRELAGPESTYSSGPPLLTCKLDSSLALQHRVLTWSFRVAFAVFASAWVKLAWSALVQSGALPAVHLLTLGVLLFSLRNLRHNPLVIRSVRVFQDRVEDEESGATKSFLFSELQKFEFRPFPRRLLGGALRAQTSSGDSFEFPIVLKKSVALLDAFASARPELVEDAGAFLKLRESAIVLENQQERNRESLTRIPAALFRLSLFPLPLAFVMAGLHGGSALLDLYLFGLLSCAGTMLVCHVVASDQILRRDRKFVHENPVPDNRNRLYEQRIVRNGQLVHGVLVLGASAALIVLALLRFTGHAWN